MRISTIENGKKQTRRKSVIFHLGFRYQRCVVHLEWYREKEQSSSLLCWATRQYLLIGNYACCSCHKACIIAGNQMSVWKELIPEYRLGNTVSAVKSNDNTVLQFSASGQGLIWDHFFLPVLPHFKALLIKRKNIYLFLFSSFFVLSLFSLLSFFLKGVMLSALSVI